MAYLKKKRKNKIQVEYLHYIVQEILNTRLDKKECSKVVANLKNKFDANTLSASLSDLYSKMPVYEKIIMGNLFPRNIQELGDGNGYFFKPMHLINEISWLYIQIVRYKKELKIYAHSRSKIEHLILLGKYNEAMEILEELTKKIGLSIWYYETKCLIYSRLGKERDIYGLLSEVNEAKKTAKTGFVPFLLHYLAKRSIPSYSAISFDADLTSRFKMNRNDFQQDRYNYYLFRLNYYNNLEVEDLSVTMIMEATNSLVDRYNLLLTILKTEFAKTENNTDRTLYSFWGTRLYRQTQDIALTPLVAYVQTDLLDQSYYDVGFINILDLYYKGVYKDVVLNIREYVKKNSSNFDIVKIYCRTLVALDNGYVPIVADKDSLLNQITSLVFKTMSEKLNDEFLFKLYNINKNIYGLSLACGLDNYIKEEQNEPCYRSLKFLFTYTFDPLFSSVINDKDSRLHYIDEGEKYIGGNSIVCEYQKGRIEKKINTALNIVSYIKDQDNAKISFNNEDYIKALEEWKDILEKYKECLPIAQTAIDYIYQCYMGIEEKQAAIVFYIEQFMKGKVYVAKVDTTRFVDQLYREKYRKGVRNSLDLLLFVFIKAKADEHKSCVLERFCAYKDVEKVSELINVFADEINRDKVELFFYLLATEDILRHMVYVESTKQKLEEQQIISQYLMSMDTNNRELYVTLNQEILDAMIVYQNIKKIDESRIFANDLSIIKYELKDQEGLYNQYRYQFELSKDNKPILVVNTANSSSCDDDFPKIKYTVRFTNKAFIDVACQLFDAICDKFLLSKFGLKTYLSTRIRHGVLEGELRSGFDRLNLVLSTQHDTYVPTHFWQTTYALSSGDQSELMKILERFSHGVNFLISEFKKNVLQIRCREEDSGFFKYLFTPDEKCFAIVNANDAQSYEEFCKNIMNFLFKVTDANLIKIRREVSENLTIEFNQLVDQLYNDIQRFNSKHFYCDLSRAVNDARADIRQKLIRIEKWFYIQDAKFDDFYLVKQMDIVWNITAKMFPNIKYELNHETSEEISVKLKAAYFIHISDILTIFYNNMFSYSRPTKIRNFKISCRVDGTIAHLHFENDILDSEDSLNQKFKEMLTSYSRLQMEGKSGLIKVKKIIKYDLACESNEVLIKAENNKCLIDVNIELKDLLA